MKTAAIISALTTIASASPFIDDTDINGTNNQVTFLEIGQRDALQDGDEDLVDDVLSNMTDQSNRIIGFWFNGCEGAVDGNSTEKNEQLGNYCETVAATTCRESFQEDAAAREINGDVSPCAIFAADTMCRDIVGIHLRHENEGDTAFGNDILAATEIIDPFKNNFLDLIQACGTSYLPTTQPTNVGELTDESEDGKFIFDTATLLRDLNDGNAPTFKTDLVLDSSLGDDDDDEEEEEEIFVRCSEDDDDIEDCIVVCSATVTTNCLSEETFLAYEEVVTAWNNETTVSEETMTFFEDHYAKETRDTTLLETTDREERVSETGSQSKRSN